MLWQNRCKQRSIDKNSRNTGITTTITFKEEEFALGGEGVDETDAKSFNLNNSAIVHVRGEPCITYDFVLHQRFDKLAH